MNQNVIKVFKQLAEIWKQLNLGQRISVVAATLVVLSGTIGLAVWSNRVNYSLLFGRLPDTEAAKVISALDSEKIPYKISDGGSSIMVPSDKVHTLRMQLAGRGIPKGDGVGYEILDKPNFGISDFVQRANYTRAIQGELARTISQLDEVESARVMVVIPENKLLLDKDKRPTASVFVRVRGNMQLTLQSVNAIRFLVANSIEGLKANNVVVADNLGSVLSGENNEPDSVSGMANSQLANRKNYEQHYAKQVQTMLEQVLGPGQAIVRVAVELNMDTTTRTEDKYDPEGQVVRSQTKNDENTDQASGNSNGGGGNNAPGNDANAANNAGSTNGVASAPSSSTKNRKVTDTTSYELSKTTITQTLSPGGIRRMSAAVTIAAKTEGTGATRKVINRAPEEMEKLKRIVQSALGIQNTGGDQITLEELPFNDKEVLEFTEKVDQQQKYQLYWEIGKNVLYFILAAASFLVLIRMIKRTPVEDIPTGVPVGRLIGRTNGNGKITFSKDGNPGAITVEVLHELIKQNPNNVTQAVRRYLNKTKTAAN